MHFIQAAPTCASRLDVARIDQAYPRSNARSEAL